MQGKSHQPPLKYERGTSTADRPTSPEQHPRPRTGNAGQDQQQTVDRSKRLSLLHIMTTHQQTRPPVYSWTPRFFTPGRG